MGRVVSFKHIFRVRAPVRVRAVSVTYPSLVQTVNGLSCPLEIVIDSRIKFWNRTVRS